MSFNVFGCVLCTLYNTDHTLFFFLRFGNWELITTHTVIEKDTTLYINLANSNWLFSKPLLKGKIKSVITKSSAKAKKNDCKAEKKLA